MIKMLVDILHNLDMVLDFFINNFISTFKSLFRYIDLINFFVEIISYYYIIMTISIWLNLITVDKAIDDFLYFIEFLKNFFDFIYIKIYKDKGIERVDIFLQEFIIKYWKIFLFSIFFLKIYIGIIFLILQFFGKI